MKTNAPIFSKIAFGILLAGSLAACNNTKTDNKPAIAATGKETIVFVNSDSLLNKYDYFKDMSKRLETKANAAKSNVGSRGQAFQREYAEYQKNASTMAADVRQSTEQRLQREQQDFQTYQQNEAAAFQNEQTSENAKLYDKIADFVKGYAKEKGYKLVLTYSKANPTVLYGDPALDVTADVAKKLNDAYSKDKK
ncbi:MAG: skp [Mucilaginibacter sp.]|nr:skp [Mucilaginibacter sp.]